MKGNAFGFDIIKKKGNLSEDRAQGNTEHNAEASSESWTRALLCSIPCILYIQ